MSAPATGPILAVTGLKREAALLAGPRVIAVAGGGDPIGLARALEASSRRHDPAGVISVGLGGALSATLQVGDWVVADRVCGADEHWTTDKAWSTALLDRLRRSGLGAVQSGPVAASDAMVVDAAAKSALGAATGALAVDMESHVAARFAAGHGLPFAVLRVISDAADRALPKAAQAGMKKDGGMDIPAVLASLLRDPRQLPALIRTGREADVAFRRLALLRHHDLLGGLGIGDTDLGELPLDVV